MVDFELCEDIVAVCEVDAGCFYALGELGRLQALAYFSAEAQVAQEGVVHCCFVITDVLGFNGHYSNLLLYQSHKQYHSHSEVPTSRHVVIHTLMWLA